MASEIKKIRRKDIAEYPITAIREALMNALLHADYSIRGTRISVAIFTDRLEITNPGMLPLGMTLNDFKNGISSVRNKVLGRVFEKMELVEQWGSGYKRIANICAKKGYPEPLWEEFSSAFRVTFFPHPAASGIKVQEAPRHKQAETKVGPRRDQDGTMMGLSRDQVTDDVELTDDELKILSFCRVERNIQEMMSLLGWKHRTKFRNKYIAPLLEKGLLRMTIPDKPQSRNQKYITRV